LRDRDANSNGTLDEDFYALQDANWNVVTVSNATGTIQERYTYTAYGVPQFLAGSFSSRASSQYAWETLYCGYRWDKTVESYHVRHRLLFPYLGRWNRHDPIQADFNLYRYVHNNPTNTPDPEGLADCQITIYGGHNYNSLQGIENDYPNGIPPPQIA